MDTLNKILSRMKEEQNEILDKIETEENSDNLIAMQLNLARGIAKIKLLATQPAKSLQPYPQNAVLYDNNQLSSFYSRQPGKQQIKNRVPFIQHGMYEINSTLEKYVAYHPKVINQHTL